MSQNNKYMTAHFSALFLCIRNYCRVKGQLFYFLTFWSFLSLREEVSSLLTSYPLYVSCLHVVLLHIQPAVQMSGLVKNKLPCCLSSSFGPVFVFVLISNHLSKQDPNISLVLRVHKGLTMAFGFHFCSEAELKNKEKGKIEERREGRKYTERVIPGTSEVVSIHRGTCSRRDHLCSSD